MAGAVEDWLRVIESEPPWFVDCALLSLPADARKSTGVVLAAVRRNGLALRAAGSGIRGDRDVVLAAVEQDGTALRYAFLELRSDVEIVSAAVRQCWQALDYASASMRSNEEVLAAGEAAHGPLLVGKAAPTPSVKTRESPLPASTAGGSALAAVAERGRACSDVRFHGSAGALGVIDVWFYFEADLDADMRVVFQQELRHQRMPNNRGVVRYIGRVEREGGWNGEDNDFWVDLCLTWTHLAKGIDPLEPASAEASELKARKVTNATELSEPAELGSSARTFHAPVDIACIGLGEAGLMLMRSIQGSGLQTDADLCLPVVDGEVAALREEITRRHISPLEE